MPRNVNKSISPSDMLKPGSLIIKGTKCNNDESSDTQSQQPIKKKPCQKQLKIVESATKNKTDIFFRPNITKPFNKKKRENVIHKSRLEP